MRHLKTPVALLAILAFAGALVLAGAMHETPAHPNPGFDRMKSLIGTWEGKTSEGKPVSITYTLISDDSAIMERLTPTGEPAMVSIYHPDGDRVMMTHYCSAHNQPRMKAEPAAADAKILKFDFVDITNLAAPDAGHMQRLVVTFEDKDHFSQEWTYKEKGVENAGVFHFARKS
jgi:hypothetical protein